MFANKMISMGIVMCCTSAIFAAEPDVTKQDLENIRLEFKAIIELYERKIQALENRLADAEESNEEIAENTEALAIEISQQGNQKAANTFNPGIGIILNGHYLKTDSDDDFSIPGFTLGEEAGPGSEGFEIGESEMNLTANIDDKFYASVTLAFGEGAEVEEAYIQTLALPNGLSIKTGRFFSNIGYLTNKHAHTDSFISRPLPYEVFLGGQYGDDGIQMSWIAATDIFWESGIELYRGEGFPAAGAADQGLGVWTFFTHLGDDISDSQSWRAGISYLSASVDSRSTELGEIFTGDSNLFIADFVWKWAPDGNSNINNALIQAEYFSREEEGDFFDGITNNYLYDAGQRGWYIQGVYQFMPQWRLGVRHSQLSSDDLTMDFAGTTLDNLGLSPKRTSLMVDWSNSEFSRIRLQFSQDELNLDKNNLWALQYIMAFGAHGGHSF